jgi:hypothetical protein
MISGRKTCEDNVGEEKMATRDLTVQLPTPIYQRLERVAQETNQPVEAVVLTSIAGNLPPSLDDVPTDLRQDLQVLQTLGDDALWAIARGKLPAAQQTRLEALLARNSAGLLTKAEQEELARLGEETDQLTLRKAHAYALLRWRGFPLPSLNEQAQ